MEEWWSIVEANLKGSFLTAHTTLPHLVKTQGYIILVSSGAAQVRFPGGSAYNLAKHSVNRLAEWIDIGEHISKSLGRDGYVSMTGTSLEYRDQGVKSFAVHPGAVLTDGSRPFADAIPGGHEFFNQSPHLSAWSYVRITSGSEDWLSGRYFDVTWNLDELTKLKEKIVEQDALKNRLALPV